MDFWTVIADLGLPIAAAIASGVFIMIVINYILVVLYHFTMVIGMFFMEVAIILAGMLRIW